MKILRFVKRWRAEALLILLLVVVCDLLPLLEVRNPKLTMIVLTIVVIYFFATWALKPRYGKNNEKE